MDRTKSSNDKLHESVSIPMMFDLSATIPCINKKNENKSQRRTDLIIMIIIPCGDIWHTLLEYPGMPPGNNIIKILDAIRIHCRFWCDNAPPVQAVSSDRIPYTSSG